jgi:hypothetical protein
VERANPREKEVKRGRSASRRRWRRPRFTGVGTARDARPGLETLIQRILRLGAAQVASEDSACDALTALRFPNGIVCPRCGAPCDRTQARVVCRGREQHVFTVLIGTPFAQKTRPRIRALLLAIRAFASAHRSVSARELARDTNSNHVTLWRHLLTLRALMPKPPLVVTKLAATTRVAADAWVRVGARQAMKRETRRPAPSGPMARLVGESVRTWLNGTFHGVSAGWLSLYLREIAARWAYDALLVAGELLAGLAADGRPMSFRRVRDAAAQ